MVQLPTGAVKVPLAPLARNYRKSKDQHHVCLAYLHSEENAHHHIIEGRCVPLVRHRATDRVLALAELHDAHCTEYGVLGGTSVVPQVSNGGRLIFHVKKPWQLISAAPYANV